jgi:hypothetical protein
MTRSWRIPWAPQRNGHDQLSRVFPDTALPAPNPLERLRQPVRLVDEHPLRCTARFPRLTRATRIRRIRLQDVVLEVAGELLEHHPSPRRISSRMSVNSPRSRSALSAIAGSSLAVPPIAASS